jgi:mandelamide amidase
MLAIKRRQFLVVAAAATFGQTRELMAATRSGSAGELHEPGLAAARAIRNGEVSSEAYVGELLERARGHADLKAFITIDEAAVLEAARQADRSLRAGSSAPLLGVPLAVKEGAFKQMYRNRNRLR